MTDRPMISRRFVAAGLSMLLGTTAVEAAILRLRGGVGSAGPSLGALSLATSTGSSGVAGSSIINGTTAGSTVTLSNTVGGKYSVSYSAPYWYLNWSTAVTAGTDTPVLVETLAGAAGSPRSSSVAVSIAASGIGTTFFVTGDSYGESYFSQYVPMAFDKQVWRTNQVPSGDEFVHLLQEMGHGFTSGATTMSVASADANDDAQYFQAGGTVGTMVFKTAVRGSVPYRDLKLSVVFANANGSSSASILTVTHVAPAHTYFLKVAGNDALDGKTPANAKKFMPGSTDYTGSDGLVFGADDVIFMKAEVHRTSQSINATGQDNLLRLPHGGTSGHQCVLEMNGWGGRATLSGDVIITGGASVTQAEVGGNPNYLNIKKFDLTSQGGAAEYCQFLFDDDDQLYPATFPTPASNSLFWIIDYGATPGTGRYGMESVPCTTSTSEPKRIYTDNGTYAYGAGTTVTIVHPHFAAAFGNVSVSTLPPFIIWGAGNHIYRIYATSYDYANSTVVIPYTAGPLSTDPLTGNGAFCYSWAAVEIARAGQFAYSRDGLTAYVWLPNNGTTSISRKRRGMAWGGQGYMTVNGGLIQRYSGTASSRSGANLAGGNAIYCYKTDGILNQIHLDGTWVRQCMSEDGDGVVHSAGDGNENNGMADTNIYRLKLYDNPRSSGIRLGAMWKGFVNGTEAQVMGYAYGRVRGVYIPDNGVQQTCAYWACCNGLHFTENVFKGVWSVHGNGLSLYDQNASVRCQHAVIEYNSFINCIRAYTTNSSTTNRYIVFRGNILLAPLTVVAYTFSPWGGEPGGRITRNLMLGFDPTYNYQYTAHFKSGFGECDHNVIAGVVADPDWTGNFHDNLITDDGSVMPVSTAGGTQTANTVLHGASIVRYWNGSFTTQMLATLGSGRIGPHLTL